MEMRLFTGNCYFVNKQQTEGNKFQIVSGENSRRTDVGLLSDPMSSYIGSGDLRMQYRCDLSIGR